MDGTLASRPALDPLFAEARRRARRRRIALAAVAVAVAAAVILWPGSHGSHAPRPAAVPTVPAKLVVENSYLGVACPTPNRIGCDRVGLAIWTKRPFRSIRATIGDRSFALSDTEWSGHPRHGLRRLFVGFLHPAGFWEKGPLAVRPDSRGGRFIGSTPVSAPVHLVITRADGSRRATTFTLSLSPGWG
jgi:hypothetical protein